MLVLTVYHIKLVQKVKSVLTFYNNCHLHSLTPEQGDKSLEQWCQGCH